jgi:BirA family biotin operon repressor/biotin-[acetyl-CoA-carboxylase] ligase
MKAQILHYLRKTRSTVSGETLSRQLGISRVAVWKHIQKLLESGYRIHSGPKGYKLVNSPDTPFAWEFPARTSHIHYFPVVSSTMDIARDMARKGCPDFTVVAAGRQEGGRGRMDRSWESPTGGLYFTLVLRPEITLVLSPLLNFAASAVLAQTIRERFRIRAAVKWPNDILAGGRKLSGMLSEMEAEGDLVSFVNIGIGINVNNRPPQHTSTATSIRTITGRAHNRREFLADYLDRLETRLHSADLSTAVDEWKAYTTTIGRPVEVATQSGTTRGKAVDVDPGGALIVRTEDGTLQKVHYGDCFHRD